MIQGKALLGRTKKNKLVEVNIEPNEYAIIQSFRTEKGSVILTLQIPFEYVSLEVEE